MQVFTPFTQPTGPQGSLCKAVAERAVSCLVPGVDCEVVSSVGFEPDDQSALHLPIHRHPRRVLQDRAVFGQPVTHLVGKKALTLGDGEILILTFVSIRPPILSL